METLEEVLRKIKFTEEEIEDIKEFVENEIDIKELCSKIIYLSELGLSSRVIRIIIEENILFLSTELKEIEEVVNYIKEKGLTEYIDNIFEVNPDLISESAQKLRRNENLLKLMLPEETVNVILRDRIEILTYNTDYLSKRLAYLVENGLKDKIETIILSRIEIFDLEDDEIEFEVKDLKKKYNI